MDLLIMLAGIGLIGGLIGYQIGHMCGFDQGIEVGRMLNNKQSEAI